MRIFKDTSYKSDDWAIEFIRCKEDNKWTLEEIDFGLMNGWFANCIIAAYGKGFDDGQESMANEMED